MYVFNKNIGGHLIKMLGGLAFNLMIIENTFENKSTCEFHFVGANPHPPFPPTNKNMYLFYIKNW